MPLTQFARDQSLQYDFTATALTRPTTWYAGLFTGFPGDAGSSFSNEATSGADPGYARVQLVGGNALALSSHIISNGGSVIWTATGTWTAPVTYWGVLDASTLGNLWAYGVISQGGASLFLAAAQLANFGSGYAVSDTITLTGGGGAVLTVDAVTTVNSVAGVVTDFHISTHGSLASIPANPMATTSSGAGTGATVLATWLAAPTSFTLNNTDTLTLAAGAIQIPMA